MPPVTDEIKSLEALLTEESTKREELINAVKGEGSDADAPFNLEEGQVTEFRASLAKSKEMEATIADLKGHESSEDFIKSLRMPEGGANTALEALVDHFKNASPEDVKSVGEAFLESEAYKEMVQAGTRTMARPFDFKGDLGAHMRLDQKDVFSAMPTGTPGSFGTIQRDPMVPRPQRTRRVRDLFGSRPTTASTIEFFRVTGFANNASVVPERDGSAFGLKPQSTLTFEGQQSPVRTVAHWEAAHRTVLADEPQLRALIEGELLYGLRLVEDDQILNGTGTGEDLLGILNTPGVQTYSWSDGPTDAVVVDNKADAIRRAMTLSLLALYEPTGVVVHDSDWEDIELTKNEQGDYLLAVSIALGGEPRVWRVPVVPTPAIDEGTALVGSFGLGAQLYDREEGNIRIAEQHSDFFLRNAIVVLAEQRLALATKRPEAFVNVTFDGPQTLA